jgi:hypothetical protein
MPDSQDDDESGYFPLVMTRKSKAALAAKAAAAQNANNGVNGS